MLRLQSVSKRFENGYLALDMLDLVVRPGEIVGIVGGSGCGKSTLLGLAAGLIQPTTGVVWCRDAQVHAPRPDVGLVFQEPRLMPWLTLAENAEFGLLDRPKAERRQRALRTLRRVGLERFADALPRELSGGMRMRVSIARALVAEPRVLLMDEPFAALDEITRFRLNDDLLRLWASQRWTVVFVTHSVFESVYLSTRIVVMSARPGRVSSEFEVRVPAPRDPSFRTSASYAEQCRTVSARLGEAMQA